MRRLLACLTIVATLLFSSAVVALLLLAPEVDPMRSGISFYALTSYGLVIGVGLALAGIAGISLSVALWPLTPSAAGRIGIVLLILWGCASILAGACPLDAPGASPTLSGSLHTMAGMNFLLIFPAALLIELSRSSLPAAGMRPSTHWLAWLLLIAAVLLFTFNGPLASLGVGGLIQRLYWLVLVFWLLFKARQLLG